MGVAGGRREYIPKNLLRIVNTMDTHESMSNYIVRYAPFGTITPQQIKCFMATMSEAHSYYIQARLDNMSYGVIGYELTHKYYNKAFRVLYKLIKYIIYDNARTRPYAKELLSDIYMYLVVWQDRFTHRRGVTKIATMILNATHGERVIDNLDKADRVINNHICFFLAGRVTNYEIMERLHYENNKSIEAMEEQDENETTEIKDIRGDFYLHNPYHKEEIIINRHAIVNEILALPRKLKDVRIKRSEFDKILRNYLKVFILGYNKALIDISDFRVAYTIFKLREYIQASDINIDSIIGKVNNDYAAIYPSFTKILADKMGVPYEDA